MMTSHSGTEVSPQSRPRAREGLRIARFLMVLSSLAPLFILWAISGIKLFPHEYVAIGAGTLGVIPTLFLLYRFHTAKKEHDKQPLTIEATEDHRGYVLTYLFAILLPFYRDTIDTYFEFAAMLTALVIVVCLFLHLNYHYINLLFAFRGYRVVMVHPEPMGGRYARTTSFAIITRRNNLQPGEVISAYRLSNTVYVEEDQ